MRLPRHNLFSTAFSPTVLLLVAGMFAWQPIGRATEIFTVTFNMSADVKIMSLGMKTDAFNDLDSYDVPAPPPITPPSLRFHNPLITNTTLISDFRAPGTSATWILQASLSGPLEITLSRSDPAGFLAGERLFLQGYGLNVDLEATSLFTLTQSGDYTILLVPDQPPVAVLSQLPPDPTRQTTATVTVGGVGLTAYKFKLDDGRYSGETVIATPISLNNLAAGRHTLAVIGKDIIEQWQAETAATSYSWTVDQAPPVLIATVPVNGTATAVENTALSLTFNEAVLKGAAGAFRIQAIDGPVVAEISITDDRVTVSGATVTVIPGVMLTPAQTYAVLLDTGAITDLVGNAYAGIADSATWRFTVAGWLFPISLTHATDTALVCGMQSLASDLNNPGIDELGNPTPSAGLSAAYWLTGSTVYRKDMRGISPEATWNLVTDTTGAAQPLQLDWSPAAIPAGCYLVLEELDSSRAVIPDTLLNLAKIATMTVATGGIRQFQLRFGHLVTTTFTMNPGWNLVALPFMPSDPRPEMVFADSATRAPVQVGPVWEWSGTGFRQASTIRAYSGLLVLVPTVKTITVTGFAMAQEALLQPGWNLIGPATKINPPVETKLAGNFWGWDGRGFRAPEWLEPGTAYWIYAREAVTIPLGR